VAIARASWQTWGGCEVVVAVQGGNLAGACAAVREVIERFDRAFSRFRPDSELSLLNANPGRPLRCSQLFIEGLQAALEAAAATGGALDPTVGASLAALGYTRTFPQLQAEGVATATAVPAGRYAEIEVDRRSQTVRLKEGCALDLGATAKALAVDRAAAAAARASGGAVLVGIGGDLALAGTPPSPWQVVVGDDHRNPYASPHQLIELRCGGLATSSTAARRWLAGAVEVNHLIEPSSGQALAGPWRTATVSASSCLGANVAATAALLWRERARELLERWRVPARLVGVDGAVHGLNGWPEEEPRWS